MCTTINKLKRSNKKRIFFIVAALLGISLVLHVKGDDTGVLSSREIIAKSGNYIDVQNAINKARRGDTVVIPAGTWTWKKTVNSYEGISLRGAGKNSTIIKLANVNNSNMLLFKINADGKGGFSFSNMTLRGNGANICLKGKGKVTDSGIHMHGKFKDFRISNCAFDGFSWAGIRLVGDRGKCHGHATGVIYKCSFTNMFYTDGSMSLGYGVSVRGKVSDWKLCLGTNNAVFVEDCIFERCRHTIAANNSARYVFRHNKVKNNYYPWAAVDAHGQYLSSHGTRSYEIYENEFSGGINYRNGEYKNTWNIGIRGGDGVIFSNTFSDVWRPVCISVEGGIKGKKYPVADQTRDLWLWNNQHKGKPLKVINAGVRNNMTDFFKEGRDYHFKKKTGYKPYTYPHPLRNN